MHKKQFDEMYKKYPEYISPLERNNPDLYKITSINNTGTPVQTFEEFLEEHHTVDDKVRLIKYLLKRFGFKLQDVRVRKN